MIYLYLFILVVLIIKSVIVRVLFFNLGKTIKNFIVDCFNWFRHKCWRECKYGFINAYVGLFGKGKTLSAVHFCVGTYLKKNDKRVYCSTRKKFVTQKIHIISNVELKTIPYEKFESLKQLVNVARTATNLDTINDTLTITIALIDEASVQLNSRNFKSNIDSLCLNTILTCRHFRLGLVFTAQRFGQVDALLRQVTQLVIDCKKVWRVQKIFAYDAGEVENATNTLLLKPQKKKGFFITNSVFSAYDTLATVDNLKKSCESGDMLTEQEILALQCNQSINMDAIINPSKKFKKLRKKLR